LAGLAIAGSRTDRYRALLIAAGAALGTIFSLAAFVVLSIDGYDERYTNNMLKEPGLRPGVATGCWLLLIPALIFIGMCTRVCAAQRERRLAAFRLAGATPKQIRSIGAIETGVASLIGAFAGLAIFLVVRAVLAARLGDDATRTLPVDEPFPWLGSLLFILGMPALAGIAGALALRGVVVSPLGVARRHRRERPPAWPGVLLISGPIALALGNRMEAFDVGAAWQVIVVGGRDRRGDGALHRAGGTAGRGAAARDRPLRPELGDVLGGGLHVFRERGHGFEGGYAQWADVHGRRLLRARL
jgi:hypothetical protein